MSKKITILEPTEYDENAGPTVNDLPAPPAADPAEKTSRLRREITDLRKQLAIAQKKADDLVIENAQILAQVEQYSKNSQEVIRYQRALLSNTVDGLQNLSNTISLNLRKEG